MALAPGTEHRSSSRSPRRRWAGASSQTIVGMAAALLVIPMLPAAQPLDAAIAHAAPAGTTYRSADPLPTTAARAQWRRRPRRRREVERLPSEYRQIASRPAVTRAEFAALLGVGLNTLLQRAARDRVVILTDTRGHWADRWMQLAARAGVMPAYPTHEFEPDRPMQRYEVAEVIAAVLDLRARSGGSRTRRWRGRDPDFADLDPTHASYEAAVRAVSVGVLEVRRDNRFRPTATVRGAEAVDVVQRLERLVRQES